MLIIDGTEISIMKQNLKFFLWILEYDLIDYA